MRSSMFVTTTVLVLALSTAAMADERDRYRSDRRDDRYQDRYDDRYRGDSRNGRVDNVAREIAETAAAMHREYDRNNRRPDRDEARVAATLRELHEEAYQFARSSSGDYRRDSRRDRGLDGLLQAFNQVAYSLDRINRRPYVDRGMDRIWSLMSQLDRQYGGRSDRYGRGWRDNGYHDRDRYRD
ncbi:MAG TPA: hypothetical protein VF179_11195 [Thermoanaerobaculia bacterium]|nr:hypothetical protein [Thermoanaerobaculia bacterium]